MSAKLFDAEQLDRLVRSMGYVTMQALLTADSTMPEEEFKQYCLKAEAASPLVLRELRLILVDILTGVAREMETLDQVIFWRGGINLIDLLDKRFKELTAKSLEFKKPQNEPPANPHDIIPTF